MRARWYVVNKNKLHCVRTTLLASATMTAVVSRAAANAIVMTLIVTKLRIRTTETATSSL